MSQDASRVTAIDVAVTGSPYKIFVGRGIIDTLADLVELPPHAAKFAMVTSQPIFDRYGARLLTALEKFGLAVHPVVVPDGEKAKNLETLQSCYSQFGRIPLGRRDIVIALGGGVIGDLAGFAAATWNRGVQLIQVATTLVAQVDSAIGGKTGVNLPEGKNLVGAFHQPLAVINDIETLRTLPERELRAGLAEVVKYGFIADPTILDLIESTPCASIHGDLDLLSELVRRSAVVKARVVGDDELETGAREVLNYGHTVGHAIETLSSYREFRHGEAVSIGMVFAARLGERLGVSEKGLAESTVRVLSHLGLPTSGISPDRARIWEILARDKKARAGVRFVLCPRPGRAILIEPPDVAVVNEVLDSLVD